MALVLSDRMTDDKGGAGPGVGASSSSGSMVNFSDTGCGLRNGELGESTLKLVAPLAPGDVLGDRDRVNGFGFSESIARDLLRKKSQPRMAKVITAMPPITPPTIAPVLLECDFVDPT